MSNKRKHASSVVGTVQSIRTHGATGNPAYLNIRLEWPDLKADYENVPVERDFVRGLEVGDRIAIAVVKIEKAK